MNWKKFFTAFIAAFFFVFVFGFLWHAKLMHGTYQEVPTLWRTETDLGNYFLWLVLGQLVLAFFLTMLFARFIPAGGAGAGATLGILVALVFVGVDLIFFAVQPLTTKILCGFVVGDLIELTIAGAIIGAIYKPASAHITFVKERPR
jgi:hypothetical protein